MTNNIILNQVYKRETPMIHSYQYETNLGYIIKVTTLDIDTHITATSIYPYSPMEIPSILFTSKESGTIEFPSKNIMISDSGKFIEQMSAAVYLYEFIKDHFEELAKGEIIFNIEEDFER